MQATQAVPEWVNPPTNFQNLSWIARNKTAESNDNPAHHSEYRKVNLISMFKSAQTNAFQTSY